MQIPARFLSKSLLVLALAAGVVCGQDDQPAVQDAQLGDTRNVHTCGSLFLAGQPTKSDIPTMKQRGIKRVVTLRQDGEINWDEAAAMKEAGLEFVSIPLGTPESLSDGALGRLRRMMRDAERTPMLLHCGSANRVGAVWLTHRVLDQEVPLEQAVREARQIGLRSAALEQRARQYIEKQSRQEKVPASINDNFLRADLDIDEWLGRFEVESREVFAARHQVVRAAGIRPGMQVADIGAGTGFFTRLFSAAVGPKGWVFAVDISPRFIEHITEQARREGITNISAVLCRQHSVTLPPQSIDLAFICDTYHHFEYPEATLESIRQALRPGGSLLLIDFKRIPGESREFILNHVRAGREVFQSEIEAAGFQFVEQVQLDGLEENYCLRFRRN